MTQIYLPSYISRSESFQTFLSSNISIKTHITAIKIRNYNLLQTLVSESLLEEMIIAIKSKIKDFYQTHCIADMKVVCVQDYCFITSGNISDNITIKLKRALYEIDFLIYVSFGLTSCCGNIAEVIPQLVQSLACSDNLLGYNYDNKTITYEYRSLSLLKKALNNKSAGFAYQPIVDSRTGKDAYHECLMRISDLHGGWISAGPAIILAEKHGIIDMVDEAVISMAAQELINFKDVKISVNVSNIGLSNEALLSKIIQVFKDNEDAKRLIIEVTETSDNADLEKIVHFVKVVQNLGIKVALDDFGVGTSSLKRLGKIKFDIIKIDGSFIKDIATNPYHRYITEIVINLAREMKALAVAECVENGEIAKILINMGVDFMQGNFFSPARNFRSWHK